MNTDETRGASIPCILIHPGKENRSRLSAKPSLIRVCIQKTKTTTKTPRKTKATVHALLLDIAYGDIETKRNLVPSW
ncbi:MAG: hypothetical protein HY014_18115 [Acidobacteria bacterium]|nr:hypothetical protein [Acidobacteriota bacterium]MBI3490053.1 hypothetical protein [Acidobacteriota bacterium]